MSAEGQAKELKAMTPERLNQIEQNIKSEVYGPVYPLWILSAVPELLAEIQRLRQPKQENRVMHDDRRDDFRPPRMILQPETGKAEAHSSSASEPRCPKCGSGDVELWFTGRESSRSSLAPQFFRILCNKCEHEATYPKLGEFFLASQQVRLQELEQERAEVMKAMCISFDPEIAAEDGDAYEVPAEPEPLYFDTLPKAVANTMALLDREITKLERAASQQVDVSAIAEEIAKRCVRAQEYAKKKADEPIQGWEFSQIARSVLQKAMGVSAAPAEQWVSELLEHIEWVGKHAEDRLQQTTDLGVPCIPATTQLNAYIQGQRDTAKDLLEYTERKRKESGPAAPAQPKEGKA